MKHSSKFLLALASTTLALAAHAGGGVKASEVPRITNGGTGVIGGMEPGAYPRDARYGMTTTEGMGAAGQAPMAMQAREATATMGAGRQTVPSIASAANPSWGTPN